MQNADRVFQIACVLLSCEFPKKRGIQAAAVEGQRLTLEGVAWCGEIPLE
jgi:hypothetical protein